MSDLVYLSLQYIRHHRIKLAVLTLAITLVAWLPLAIQSVVDQTAEQLLYRAKETPLVIGAPGSPLELTLSSLYFSSASPRSLPRASVDAVDPDRDDQIKRPDRTFQLKFDRIEHSPFRVPFPVKSALLMENGKTLRYSTL